MRSFDRTFLVHPLLCEACVDLVTRSAWLRFESDSVADLDGVVEALTARGFSAHPRETTAFGATVEADRSWGWWKQWRQLIVALVLLVLSVVGHLAEA